LQDIELRERIRKNLKRLRKNRNLSQEEVARKVGISRPLLSAYEIGRAKPSKETLKSLADFYNTTIDELMDIQVLLLKRHNEKNKTQLGFESKETIPSDTINEITQRKEAFFTENENKKTCEEIRSIPVLTCIPSPFLSFTTQNIERTIPTETQADMAYTYELDNMAPFVQKGDLLLVKTLDCDRFNSIKDGTVVFVSHRREKMEDMILMCRFYNKNPYYILKNDNALYEPLFLTEENLNSQYFIIGEIVEVRRNYKKEGGTEEEKQSK